MQVVGCCWMLLDADWMLQLMHLRGQRTVSKSNQQGSQLPVDQKMTASLEAEELSTTGRTTSLNLLTGKITTSRRAKTDHIVLREWLFQHRYNAYPTRAETLILAMKTELTTKQVRTWFINARRRILPEIIRREGREPEKFIRTRTCFSFFCSTTVTGPTSSTSFSSCPCPCPCLCPYPCSEKNTLSHHQSLNIFTTYAHPDQPLDLSLKESISTAWSPNIKTFTC